jgi:hypothetical protein
VQGACHPNSGLRRCDGANRALQSQFADAYQPGARRQFILDRFQHRVRWNEADAAIEMHLLSSVDQTVTVSGLAATQYVAFVPKALACPPSAQARAENQHSFFELLGRGAP